MKYINITQRLYDALVEFDTNLGRASEASTEDIEHLERRGLIVPGTDQLTEEANWAMHGKAELGCPVQFKIDKRETFKPE